MIYDAEVNRAVADRGRLYPGLTRSLVHSVLEQESRHGTLPSYVRHGGAVPEPGGHTSYGPMQVYDDTIASYGVKDPRALIVPAVGIWYGADYLGRQLKRFKGDVARAIAAYNAGPGNAVRSTATGRFPNQSYVNSVLGFLNQYRTVTASALPLALLVGVGWYMLSGRRRRAA